MELTIEIMSSCEESSINLGWIFPLNGLLV
jgi:hypothetical protein